MATPIELYSTPLFNDADLASYWRFEGNSNDSKSSKNGTDTSMSYSSTDGLFGQHAVFGGSGYINFGNNYNFERTNSWSVSLWFKTASMNGILLGKQNSASPYNGWYIAGLQQLGSALRVGMTDSGGGSLIGDSVSTYTDSAWHHLVMTYNGTSQNSGLLCYIDGSAISLTYTNTISATIQTSFNLQAGARNGANSLFTGRLEEVAIFNRVLKATEISNLHDGTWPSGAWFAFL